MVKEKFANGTKEFGTFSEGNLDGFGTLISDTGTKYEGDWVDGVGVGVATITYKMELMWSDR